MVLITYLCKMDEGSDIHGHEISESAEVFIEHVQKYETAVYYIINVLELSDEFSTKYTSDIDLNGS